MLKGGPARSHCSVVLGFLRWTQHSICGLTSAESRGRITSSPQDAIGLLCHEGTLLAYVQLVFHKEIQIFFCQAASQSVSSSLYWCLGWFFLRGRTLHFPLMNFMRFLSLYFSSLPKLLWMAALPPSISITPPSLVSSMNLSRVHYIIPSELLI